MNESRQIPPEAVAPLTEWHVEGEKAEKYNRNLLQYGSGLAAVLGIVCGSGGIVAVATALIGRDDPTADPPDWVLGLLGVLAGVFVVFGIPLLMFTLKAWRNRARSETLAREQLRKLIGSHPDGFFPPSKISR